MLMIILLSLLLVLILSFSVVFAKDLVKTTKENKFEKETSFWKMGVLGFIALFLDVIGIGSFNTITTFSKNFNLIKDKTLPGTLIVSTTIAGAVMAIVFVTTIEVDTTTLVTMLVSSSIGGYVGAGYVSKLPEKWVQFFMGLALAVVAFFVLLGQLKLIPVGGNANGLYGWNLVIAGAALFFLGALMTVGVGLFAPCMALVFAMGMSPDAAFPIMMTACAFLQPLASFKFIKAGAYDRKASLAITIFGVIGALISSLMVRSIPLYTLKWVIFTVVSYTSFQMFKSYGTSKIKAEEKAYTSVH